MELKKKFFQKLTWVLLIGAFLLLHWSTNTGTTNISGTIEVSEIMYDNPVSDYGGEWIEFYNSSGGFLDISGWTFTISGDVEAFAQEPGYGDITNIAPGDYFLLIEQNSTVAFLTQYSGISTSIPIARTTGAMSMLNTGGDTIVVNNGTSDVQNFSYPNNATNASMYKNPILGDEDQSGSWAQSSDDYSWGAGYGNPGELNNGASDNQTLAGTPDMTSAVADDNSGGGAGIQSGDRVILTFNSATNAFDVTGGSGIDTNLDLSDSHSWGDVTSADWSSGDTVLTITFAGTGSPDVAVGDTITIEAGTIKDSTDTNDATGSPPSISGSFDTLGVVINEICYDVSGADTNKEWIELYNNRGTDVNIGGWKIEWGGSTFATGTYTIPADTTILASGYYLIGGSLVASEFGVAPDLIKAFTFQNGGDYSDGVRIWDGVSYYDTVLYDSPNALAEGGNDLPGPDGTVDDGTTVGTELCPDVAAGHSLSRVTAGVDTNQTSDWEDLASPTPQRSIDTTAPVILSAVADDASGEGAGIQAGDQVIITFNEAMDPLTIDKDNINSALPLSDGHSWLDGDGNIGSATWSGGDTVLTITLSIDGLPSVDVDDIIDPPGSGYLKDVAGIDLDDLITITGSFAPLVMRVNYVFWGEGSYGDCIFIELPGADGSLDTSDDKYIIIDGGNADTQSESSVDEFLDSKGITEIDFMVQSHDHPDHYKGLEMIKNDMGLPVYYVYECGNFARVTGATATYIDVSPGDILSGPDTDKGPGWDNNVKCEVLSGGSGGANEDSMALKVSLGSSTFIFGGDLLSSQENSLDTTKLSDIEIYKVHHHGSNTSSGASFLSSLSLQYAVQQDGGGSDHPYADALSRIKTAKGIIYRNDLDGDVIVKCDDQGNYDIVRSCVYPPGKNPSGAWTSDPVVYHPALPTGLAVTEQTASSISLDWDDVVTDENGGDISGLVEYDVFRATSSGGDPGAGMDEQPGMTGDSTGIYVKVTTTPVSVSEYTDDTVSEGTTYYYRVSAIRTDYYYERRYSNEASGTASTGGVGGGGGYGGYGGCFIATAAYGVRSSEFGVRSKEVETLRRFRDKYLLTNVPGRAFVRFYYRHSPGAAAFISRHEPLRAITRFSLKPIVWLTRRVVNDEL